MSGLAVDDVFQRVDELPHLPGGDPAGAFRGCEGIATSRSFVWNKRYGGRHSGLELLD